MSTKTWLARDVLNSPTDPCSAWHHLSSCQGISKGPSRYRRMSGVSRRAGWSLASFQVHISAPPLGRRVQVPASWPNFPKKVAGTPAGGATGGGCGGGAPGSGGTGAPNPGMGTTPGGGTPRPGAGGTGPPRPKNGGGIDPLPTNIHLMQIQATQQDTPSWSLIRRPHGLRPLGQGEALGGPRSTHSRTTHHKRRRGKRNNPTTPTRARRGAGTRQNSASRKLTLLCS